MNHQERMLSDFLTHPRYYHDRDRFNIALVFWNGPLDLGPDVRPITLPPQGAAVPYGKAANVIGWGRTTREDPHFTDILNVVTVPFIADDVCNRTSVYNGRIFDDMLCAGPLDGSRGACNGDG